MERICLFVLVLCCVGLGCREKGGGAESGEIETEREREASAEVETFLLSYIALSLVESKLK